MKQLSIWIDERIHLSSVLEFLSKKTVPRHRHSFWYLFGGLTLFFFLVQLVTGMLLLLYYSPTPATANESVHFIVEQVPFGWLVHTLHSWSANLMIVSILIHLISTYFLKSYRKPREVMWLTGVVLLFIVLGFAFTGYLLPWDTTAYFATQIGTEIPKTIPVIGNIIVTILRGGQYIADDSLKRLFALHAVIFPILISALIFFHLVLNQVHGSSLPLGIKPDKPGIRFYPNYLFRDGIAWLTGLIILLTFSLLFPISIGPKADPYASAPVGIKPEWYFLPLFQSLRMVPATIAGLNSEMVVNIGVGLGGLLLFLVPFLDKKAKNEQQSEVFKWAGIVIVAYMLLCIFLAYLVK